MTPDQFGLPDPLDFMRAARDGVKERAIQYEQQIQVLSVEIRTLNLNLKNLADMRGELTRLNNNLEDLNGTADEMRAMNLNLERLCEMLEAMVGSQIPAEEPEEKKPARKQKK